MVNSIIAAYLKVYQIELFCECREKLVDSMCRMFSPSNRFNWLFSVQHGSYANAGTFL
jgi:hypothetical protein